MAENATHEEQVKFFPNLDKFHEIEIQQIFEALINIQTLRIQSGTFFATTNLGTLGVAFSTEKSGIIFLASMLILAFFIVDTRGRSSFAALHYRARQLQREFAPNDTDTFLSLLSAGYLEKEIRVISQLESREARVQALMYLPIKSRGLVNFWLPLIAFIGELAIGLILWLAFDWPLF